MLDLCCFANMYSAWDEDVEVTWDNVINKLSSYGPIFACNADNIEILSTPHEFYESLVEHASNANDRILISTLYIGQGDKEQHLVKTIENTIQNNPNVAVSMIMDCSRSTRNINTHKSSLHTLLPLFNDEYSGNVDIHLFRTPQLRSFWNLFPDRAKEVAGVHHMKAFIFDDTLIISGANLNETYLNNRQDRYFVFKHCKPMTDHVYNMMNQLTRYCPNVEYDAAERTFNINMDINKKTYKVDGDGASMQHEIAINVANEPLTWIEFVAKQLMPFTKPNTSTNDEAEAAADTYVVMGTQMMDQIRTDSQITSCVLSMPNIDLQIGTAYFNMANAYHQIVMKTYGNMYRTQRGSLQVLTASEGCNSFYQAPGLAGYVTPLYEHFATQFENAIQNVHRKHTIDTNDADDNGLFTFYRYNRSNWTYHGKGIWGHIHPQNKQHPFSFTMIGSSNYGERSVHRDSELNLTVVTKNELLISRFKTEWQGLIKHTQSQLQPEEENKSAESTSFVVKLLSGFCRHFM
eukprot:580904_1